MERPRISEAEWEVMEALWNKTPAPQTATEVIAGLGGIKSKTWAVNTVRTLLGRLVRKHVVKVSKAGGVLSFEPLFSRAECIQQETESFLGRVFGGAASAMVLNFVKQAELSDEDLKELRRIVKQKEQREQ